MNDQRDNRSPHDRLLGLARAARERPLAEQRRTATALMRMALGWEENGGMKPARPERIELDKPNPFAKVADLRAPQAPACTESEIFEAVYGEPTGTKHWNALLGARDVSDDNVAEALARHLTIEKLCEETERKSLRNTGLSILDLTKQECAHALDKIPPGALRDRLLQLFEDPNTRHLIPASLEAVLIPAAPAAPPSEAAKAPQRKVPEAELVRYLKGIAAKQHTKRELRKLTQDHFPARVVPWRTFDKAYTELPSDQKFAPGERRGKAG